MVYFEDKPQIARITQIFLLIRGICGAIIFVPGDGLLVMRQLFGFLD
jgi:hypothetical protein